MVSKIVLAQPFAANGAVVALNVGVLLRLAWLDVCNGAIDTAVYAA